MRRVTAEDVIGMDEVRRLARSRFGDMVKGVVDLKRRVMLLDADLYFDVYAAYRSLGNVAATTPGEPPAQ